MLQLSSGNRIRVVSLAVIASAPAKTILFGEHFVVYSEPAMVQGTPSGIDPIIATYGGAILCKKAKSLPN